MDDEYYRPMICTSRTFKGPTEGKDGNKDTRDTNTGHITNEIGEKVESVMIHSFNRRRACVIPRGSVGLDSMSSVDVFGEKRMLSNIRTVS